MNPAATAARRQRLRKVGTGYQHRTYRKRKPVPAAWEPNYVAELKFWGVWFVVIIVLAVVG